MENIKNISRYIDHTILKSSTTNLDIETLCSEANQYNFASVCVLPHYVAYAKNLI